ncbi:MAG: cytochrome c oxidase subunit II [Candidatus Wallbacteria bacterium]|nr:cytochrome c oxidase subunit II [Candidatus Wallbacteria bacterium]
MTLGTPRLRPRLALALAFSIAAVLTAVAAPAFADATAPAAAPAPRTYRFGDWPPDLSKHGAELQGLYDKILYVTGAVFFLTEGLLLFFLWKYRAQPGKRAHYSHGHMGLEVGWTLLPVVIFVVLGVTSADMWARMKDRNLFPKDAFTVKVTGRQFEWLIRYPGKDGLFGTEDDYETINDLHVPYDKPVRVRLTAQDVIHSFFLPELRVKQDAVPGLETEIWFEASRAAKTEIACAELCGLGHYRMRGSVTIEPLPQVLNWIQTEKEDE